MPRGSNTKITKRPGCELCERTADLTFHHLIPRKAHRRSRYKKRFSKQELTQGIYVCHLCHRGIHRLHNELTLAARLSTKQALLEDEAVARHIAWVRKQKRGLRQR